MRIATRTRYQGWLGWESEGPMLPMGTDEAGNDRGGTGPWFRVLRKERASGRLVMNLKAQTKLEEFRELDAGNPHVQFDEGVGETDRGYDSARSAPRKRVIAAGAAKPERYRASTPPLHR